MSQVKNHSDLHGSPSRFGSEEKPFHKLIPEYVDQFKRSLEVVAILSVQSSNNISWVTSVKCEKNQVSLYLKDFVQDLES